jgi:hypothetical protein
MATDAMSERLVFDAEQAIGFLPDTDRIHTFRNPAGMLIGADWDRDDLVAAMRKAEVIDGTGESAQNLGHGLAFSDEHGMLFIETKGRTDAEVGE